jgi:acetyl esterase/lipase
MSNSKRVKRVSAEFFCFVLLALPCMAQTSAIDISGTVSDADGRPIAGARVTLSGPEITDTTDAAGNYRLVRIGSGIVPGESSKSGNGFRSFTDGLFHRYDGNSRRDRESLFDLIGRRVGNPRTRESGALQPDPTDGRTLAKPGVSGAAVDSLDVLAIGFERAGRTLTASTGRQDFRLKPLVRTAIPYKTGAALSAYEKDRCKLDVHVPAGVASHRRWPVIVHLHGGGLHGGDRSEGWTKENKNGFLLKLSEAGMLIVSPDYRLGYDPDLPRTGVRGAFPDYLKDAAAAIAWAKRNAEPYGGDPDRFFVMGYSGGSYLAAMVAQDTSYYREIGFDPKGVSGYLPLSAQAYTYGQVAWERGISDRTVTVAALLGHVRKIDAPMHFFMGGNEGGRIADIELLVKRLKDAGSPDVALSVMPGRDHEAIIASIGNAVDATREIILDFIATHSINK